MKKDVETSLVNFLANFPTYFRTRKDSLEEFNSMLYNEHIVLIENNLLDVDYLSGVLNKVNILLAANTATAISILTGPPTVDIIGTLDKVSTKRSPLDSAVRSGSRLASFATHESARGLCLPSYDSPTIALEAASPRNTGGYKNYGHGSTDKSLTNNDNSSLTSYNDKVDNSKNDNRVTNKNKTNINNNTYEAKKDRNTSTVVLGKDTIKNIMDQEGLSTGKQFSVVFERNGESTELLMRVRLNCKSLDTNAMSSILALSDQTQTFSERWLRAKIEGFRSIISDGIFQQKLIDEYRKNRYRDKTGYYKQIMEKKNSNWLSGLFSLDMSINNASSVMVISTDTVESLTAQLGGPISDFNVRTRIMKDSLLTYIVVIDPEWDKVIIYTRGMDGEMELDKSDFRSAKNSGGDVNKIIDAYRAGAQPSL